MIIGSISASQEGSKPLQNKTVGNAGAWKEALSNAEARAINPLHDVNQSRNQLILDAVTTGDWKLYDSFQAKQHPAWYDTIDGVPTKNKQYWARLVDSRADAVKAALADNDHEEAAKWQAALDQSVEELKKAPGAMPHIVAFANNSSLGQQYNVEPPSSEWYDSKYNHPLVASQGKFAANMWYENPYFEETPEALDKVVDAINTHGSKEMIEVANEVNKGLLSKLEDREKEEAQDKEEVSGIKSSSIRDLQFTQPLTQQLTQSFAASKTKMSVEEYLLEQL
ncbi:hypothetical protein [Alkalihalophilus marmarensis]|uniref:Uncharacterized protein n=1 Tax=Alkalihalophilus marmarensis DSM 21297 TaxID=1188261 RepID=U6SK04_9BACI|nr:hypothetical protein [Alkalihalophilus marmarensis]ERN52054.1 hypothetical protein A33I_18345 [Alkalihalophilus marmarensis DSM 21297]